MLSEVSYPHIVKSASDVAHLERVPRVRVAQIVMDHLAHGWSAEEILRHHPYLKPAEVHAALGYYYDNQTEINGEIEAELKEIASQKPPSSRVVLRMRLPVRH